MWLFAKRALFALCLLSLFFILVYVQLSHYVYKDADVVITALAVGEESIKDLRVDSDMVTSARLLIPRTKTLPSKEKNRENAIKFSTLQETSLTTRQTSSTVHLTTTTSGTTTTTRKPVLDRCVGGAKKNIMFLKTHKTGSSTLQNIIVRKAYQLNAFVGLPANSILFNYSRGVKFKSIYMKRTPAGKSVNMLVHHMVFDRDQVSRVLPADSVYITILRDPVTQFESAFNYMRKNVKSFKRVHPSMGVGEYVNRPERYFNGSNDGVFWWFGKNNVMFDFGFNNTLDTPEYVAKSVKFVEDTFDLVLIAEYFDMGILLMKELLCWDMTDIVYISMNSRNHTTVEHTNAVTASKIRQWNRGDTALYEHFNKTFWKRVDKYGRERMYKDLEELERLKNETKKCCVQDDLVSSSSVKSKIFRMFSPGGGVDITQYQLNEKAKRNQTCIGLVLPEAMWYNKFNYRQYPRVRVKAKIKNV